MIYVLGSLNVDMVAQVARMPRVGETVLADDWMTNAGGKGLNQAIAAARMGASVTMIGAVGSDAHAVQLRKALYDSGVDTRSIGAVNGPSGMAMITVCQGQNSIIVVPGANAQLADSDVDRGLAQAGPGDILLVSLEIPLQVAGHALRVAGQRGMTTVLNPAPASVQAKDLCALCDIIVPNETETQLLSQVDPTDEVHTALAVRALRQLGARDIVLTLGAAGCAVTVDQTITIIEARKVEVVDTTAAGDTFVGALCARIEAGDDLVAAAEYANKTAALTVTRAGAAISIPIAEEVDRFWA